MPRTLDNEGDVLAVNLMWFRNDLRVEDNPALWHAAERAGTVVGLFILTPEQWQSHDMAGCRLQFLLATVEALRMDLDELGIPLQVLWGDDFASVPRRLAQTCADLDISAVFWNNEYPWDEVQRDRAVEKRLAEQGVATHTYHDRVLLPPDSLLTGEGTPYKVFTPFKKSLLGRLDAGLPDLFARPRRQQGIGIELNRIPASLAGFESHVDAALFWPAGEREARRRLDNFIDDGLADYQRHRDIPAVDGTSTLSPYLAVGSLSPQQCLLAALAGPRGGGADTWISEIIWRDFYQYVAWHFPRVCRHRPFNPDTESVAWRHSEEDFAAWKAGATGVPLVDAGMRQLRTTGWMHNRVRMVTAMFLTKNLLIDWRLGERFFMEHLVDGDFCANNGGWQWSASTGTDAAPYFRIFNAFTQAERFDPDAVYIRRHVEELQSLEPADIHKPTRLQKRRPESYPPVMVDLKWSRQRAIAAFKT